MTRDTPLNLRYGHADTVSVSILMLEIILILSVAGCSMVAAGADSNPDLDFSGLDPNEVMRLVPLALPSPKQVWRCRSLC